MSYIDQIRTPLLVIQGANDPRVPRQEEDQTRPRSIAGEFLLAHLT